MHAGSKSASSSRKPTQFGDETLPPFDVSESSVRSSAVRLRKRRAGEVRSNLADAPARDALDALRGRQRRMLGLQAAGHTYDEIVAATGDSWRTVDRQLVRARKR